MCGLRSLCAQQYVPVPEFDQRLSSGFAKLLVVGLVKFAGDLGKQVRAIALIVVL